MDYTRFQFLSWNHIFNTEKKTVLSIRNDVPGISGSQDKDTNYLNMCEELLECSIGIENFCRISAYLYLLSLMKDRKFQ